MREGEGEREKVRPNRLVVGVCMYKDGPAGYKIMGIDTKRENTLMPHRPEGEERESDCKRVMGDRMCIKSRNSPYRSKVCMQLKETKNEGERGEGLMKTIQVERVRRHYRPITLTCGDDGAVTLSTALNTLVDHSSSPFLSSRNAMLNVLEFLSFEDRREELDS